jgi:EmrB/QacA subfamily drug resistance transporter
MSARSGSGIFRGSYRLVLVVTILGAGIVFLDSSVANVALPAIQRDLGISTALQQWVASGYLLTLSALLLVGGRLTDVYGRKRVFRTGIAAYSALAIAAGLAPSGLALAVIRAVQGAAGALLVPTTLALINANFPPGERGRAIGLWSGWSGISTILGPVLAGVIIDRASWRLAFLISPTLGILTLVLSRGIPESRDETASGRPDLLGIALVALGLAGPVFSLIEAPILGWTSPTVLAAAAVGLLLLALFVLHERTAEDPALPFALFSNRNLTVANVVTLFVYAGLYGSLFYVSLYVQTALGASATATAALFIPDTILLFFLSPIAGRLNDRYGPRWLLCFGPLTAAAGLAVVGLTGRGQLLTVTLPGFLLFGTGMGFTVAPVTTTAIGSAEERFSGVASGFNNAVSRIAGLLAIAVMGVVVVQLWEAGLASVAAGTPPAVETALASVRGRVFAEPDTSGLSPADVARVMTIRDTASREAFRNGMFLAAALVAGGGGIAGVFVRNPERGPRQEADSGYLS